QVGTRATLREASDALMPSPYYALQAPNWLRQDLRQLTPLCRQELERFGSACRSPEMSSTVRTLFDRLLPHLQTEETGASRLEALLLEHGFDREQHERIRADLKRGLIGLAQNRLPANSVLEDVRDGDVIDATGGLDSRYAKLGQDAIARGEVAVV